MLCEFIVLNREEIIRRCRAKVATRPEMVSSACLHGSDLLRQGFTVSQVVHDYGDVCQSITGGGAASPSAS